MSHSITSRKDLLMSSLQTFFGKSENIIKIISVINNNRKISLRVIDWFVTNYSKKCNVSYITNNNSNKIVFDKDKYYIFPSIHSVQSLIKSKQIYKFKNANIFANRLVKAFQKNKLINPIPSRFTKKISQTPLVIANPE